MILEFIIYKIINLLLKKIQNTLKNLFIKICNIYIKWYDKNYIKKILILSVC